MLSTTSGRAAYPTTLILVMVMTLAAAGCSLPAGDSGAATAAASAQTAAAQANTAAIAAGGVATQVAAQATVAATTVGGIATQAAAAADRAEAARATVVAAAERATAPPVPTPAPAGSEVVLDGGIRITYRDDSRAGVALYRVDGLVVYRSFEELKTAWGDRAAMLWLALIETAPQANTWSLLHAVPISSTIPITPALPVSTGPITPTGWSEYTVYAQLNIGAADGAGGAPSLVFSSPHVDETQQQQVITTTLFGAAPDVPLRDVLNILPNQGLIQQLLLQEERDGSAFYTLLVIDPDPGAGVDPTRRWCLKARRPRLGVCRRI